MTNHPVDCDESCPEVARTRRREAIGKVFDGIDGDVFHPVDLSTAIPAPHAFVFTRKSLNDAPVDTSTCPNYGSSLEDKHRKIEPAIQGQGWHITSVMAAEETSSSAYSTGLTECFGHPELLMVGWDHDTMVQTIHAAALLVQAGTSFEARMYSHDVVSNTRTIFLPLPPADAAGLLPACVERYGEEGFKALLVVPDRFGRVSPPGEKAVSTAQPLVWTQRWITAMGDHVICIEQDEWSPDEYHWNVANDFGKTFAAGMATSIEGAQALAIAEMVAVASQDHDADE